MKTSEDIIIQEKYKDLENLVLICEAMDEFAREVSIVALAKSQKEIEELTKVNEELVNMLNEWVKNVPHLDDKYFYLKTKLFPQTVALLEKHSKK